MKYLIIAALFIGLFLNACSDYDGDSPVSYEGNQVGIVLNSSSYKLKVVDPTDSDYYVELEPDEYSKWGLEDKSYTFTFYYASDDEYYGSATFRINSVGDDVEVLNTVFDWAVIVEDRQSLGFGYWTSSIDYYP